MYDCPLHYGSGFTFSEDRTMIRYAYYDNIYTYTYDSNGKLHFHDNDQNETYPSCYPNMTAIRNDLLNDETELASLVIIHDDGEA